ncbi:hypothetical protein HMPREF3192_00279 [Atopobium deltae]|uniref:Uncharacterized protein n=1 Tax=Atopobium deltae TaxID=1393034 RepID=A0A133XWV0_9ACTN|nr:hypothetical protein HMPREF3192_00279 [Atopobium deltae]
MIPPLYFRSTHPLLMCYKRLLTSKGSIQEAKTSKNEDFLVIRKKYF